MRKILYIILCCLSLCACQKSKIERNEKQKEIVIHFQNYNPQSYTTPGGMSSMPLAPVLYIDQDDNLIEYKTQIDQDTLIIACLESFKEVGLSYRNFEYNYYPFVQGDTIIITLDSLDYPVINCKNNPRHERFYNLNHKVRSERTHQSLEPKTWLKEYIIYHIANNIDYVKSQNWKIAKDFCNVDTLQKWHSAHQTVTLDSISKMKSEQLISEELYERYADYLKLKNIESRLFQNKDTAYYRQMEAEISDDKIQLPSYHKYLQLYLGYFIKHIPLIKTNNGSLIDWGNVFEKITVRPLPTLSKQDLLAQCVNGMKDDVTPTKFQEYLARYIQLTGDSTLYKKADKEYNLSKDADQLYLQSMDGKETNFAQLLEKLKGSVVYIDFWASWCGPCRAEKDAAKALRQKFKSKDVAFVYLSLDSDREQWVKASQADGMSALKYNYLVLNTKSSKLLNQLNVSLIPRFILVDRQGNIKMDNAPRPSNSDTSALIDELLHQ